MRLLGRYLSRSVLNATLLVLAFVVGLDFIFTLLDELGSLNSQYRLPQALVYLLMRLPERIYMFLPAGILIGVLVGLGSLASTSELTVMRAAGVSIPRLILNAARPILVLLLLAMLTSEFFLQTWVQAADTYRWEARSGQQRGSIHTTRDLWLHEEGQFYRINLARDDGQLLGITRYRIDSQSGRLQQRMMAASATYQADGQWLLDQVVIQTFSEDALTEARQDSQLISLPVEPRFIALQAYDTADLPPSQLWHYARYLDDRGHASGFYWLAFWQKVLLPVTVFSVVLLGASFTFGPLRSVPAGTRIFYGVLLGLSVQFGQDMLGPGMLLWHFPPILAILIPAVLCGGWGWWLIRRAG